MLIRRAIAEIIEEFVVPFAGSREIKHVHRAL